MSRFISTAAVNVDSTDSHGWTPLFIACLNGHIGTFSLSNILLLFAIDVAKLLLEHAATLEHVETEYGWTPVYAGIANNHLDIVRFLVQSKVNVSTFPHFSLRPLLIYPLN